MRTLPSLWVAWAIGLGLSLAAIAAPKEWDVNSPKGSYKSVKLNVERFTWSNVDVSPDGKTIAFDMLGNLYTAPINGGEATEITSGLAWDMQPVFSPDGQSIAFISDRKGADNIWMLDLKSQKIRQISTEEEHSVHNPSFSPDGQFIVVKKGIVSARSIPGGEIWLYHRDGGKGVKVRELLHGKGTQKSLAEPVYDRTGKYLFYSADSTAGKIWEYNKDATGQIFVIKRWHLKNGEEETFISGAGGAIRPTPSPDGKSLAFVKRVDQKSAIFLKDLKTGEERMIYRGLDRDLQEADGSLGNTPKIAFTPDSSSIVFWAAGEIRRVGIEQGEVRTIPIKINTERKIKPALRYPVAFSKEKFKVKASRWITPDPKRNRLYFQALGRIYMKELDSGRILPLTDFSRGFEFFPTVSRNHQQLAYTTWSDKRGGQIMLRDLDNNKENAINVEPGHYTEVALSPDSKAVTYKKISGGYLLARKWSEEPGLYYQPLGKKPVKLTASGDSPHFGKDSDRIFFTRFNYPENKLTLYSVNIAGEDEIAHYEGSDISSFTVSPDGKWLAFTEQFRAYITPFAQTGKVISIQANAKNFPVAQVSKRAGEFLNWTADSQRLYWSNGSKYYSSTLNETFAFVKGAKAKLRVADAKMLDLDFEFNKPKKRHKVAFVGATIVTMRDAEKQKEIIKDGVVVVEGDRILAVGPQNAVKIPRDAKKLNLKGKTIFPGLIDAHAHGPQGRDELIPEQNWKNYSSLSFGVTTIHDPSNDTSQIFAASELQKAGLIVGPRIFSTGTILYGAIATGATAKVKDYEDAKFHIQRLKDVGAISVKSYQQPQRRQRQMLVAAGEELEMMVVPEGGAKFEYNMAMIADGHTGIEHAIPLATAYDDVLKFWSASNVGYTPTFVVAYGGLTGETYWYDRTDVWQDDRLMSFVPEFAVEPRSKRRIKAPDHHYNHFAVAETAKKLRDRGVTVHIGAHGQREGLAAHWELWIMEQGGFTPWEAMRSGTIDGARYLGMDHEIGSLEVGKKADLIVVSGDPLNNVRHSKNVDFTMVDGRLFEAATMNEVTGESRERQAFFFEGKTGVVPHPATAKAIHQTYETFHWVHQH